MKTKTRFIHARKHVFVAFVKRGSHWMRHDFGDAGSRGIRPGVTRDACSVKHV